MLLRSSKGAKSRKCYANTTFGTSGGLRNTSRTLPENQTRKTSPFWRFSIEKKIRGRVFCYEKDKGEAFQGTHWGFWRDTPQRFGGRKIFGLRRRPKKKMGLFSRLSKGLPSGNRWRVWGSAGGFQGIEPLSGFWVARTLHFSTFLINFKNCLQKCVLVRGKAIYSSYTSIIWWNAATPITFGQNQKLYFWGAQ